MGTGGFMVFSFVYYKVSRGEVLFDNVISILEVLEHSYLPGGRSLWSGDVYNVTGCVLVHCAWTEHDKIFRLLW